MGAISKDNYRSVSLGMKAELRRLEDKAAKLEIAIHIIEELIEGADEAGQGESTVFNFKGLSVVEASKKYLKFVGQPCNTRSIVQALEKGGIVFKTKKPYSSVYTTLSRAQKRGIVLKDSKWTLDEWEPNENTQE